MTVSVNTPQIRVTLIKTVNRKDNSVEVLIGDRNNRDIDLTPYLTEGSSVTTNKAINNPNGGFSIRLAAQMIERLEGDSGGENPFHDTFYGLIEPMDVVEIRMSRVGVPKMVMRGIVTDTSLSESMGADGRPSRTLTITGGDYGCILRMIQIYFLRGGNVDAMLHQMSLSYLQDIFGIKFVKMSGAKFVQEIVDRVVNKFIAGIDNNAMPGLLVDIDGADPIDTVFPNGSQANPQGSMWSHIKKHGNLGPFNEAIIVDDESWTTLLYRKPPYTSLWTGDYIFPHTSAESFAISAIDVTSITRARSEHDVANYYYVRNQRSELSTAIDTTLMTIIGDGSHLTKKDYPSCDVNLYGFRQMEVETNHSVELCPSIRGLEKADYERACAGYAEYMRAQIKHLQDCNVDNVIFESGSIRCNGSPDYRPGMYFEADWGNDNTSSGYVTNVTHAFEPFKGYTCTLQYIRGDGFVKRARGMRPYFYGPGVYE